MKHLVSAMLIVVGVIHLMRHRAVLFGLLGAFMVFAAFRPALQTLAFVGGFVSVVSFLWLAWSVGGYNAEVNRVFVADLVALGCLVVGAAVKVALPVKAG